MKNRTPLDVKMEGCRKIKDDVPRCSSCGKPRIEMFSLRKALTGDKSKTWGCGNVTCGLYWNNDHSSVE